MTGTSITGGRTLPMTPVYMRTRCDCMLASFAMLLGITYEEAADYFPPKAVRETGYRWEWFVPYVRANGIYLTHHDENTFSSIDWTKPAMVDVPSLVYDDGDHIIFWDGTKVIDPSTSVKYDKLPPVILNVYQLKMWAKRQ